MGRKSTGAPNLEEATCIQIRDLIKNKALVEGRLIGSHIKLLGGLQLLLTGFIDQGSGYLDIAYKTASSPIYRVSITGRPSPLGKGYIYVFICPRTGRRARALYKAYDHSWISFYGFKGGDRLYYPAQRESKLERATRGYYSLKEKIKTVSDPLQALSLQRRINSYNLYRLNRLQNRLLN